MRGARAWALVSILGLGGLAACGDGQAPPNYRGEPLLSLNGTVTASESVLTQNLVPALVVSEGSWWLDWQKWVARYNGGAQVPAREPGGGMLEVLEDAPGSYANVTCFK